MPLAFSDLCTLLDRLEGIESRDPPILLAAEKKAQLRQITDSWFKSHRRTINEASSASCVALLSALLPERRTDLVYGLQAPRLCRVLSRALGLGASRARDLQAYTRPGHGDLAACLERVLLVGGPPAVPAVNLEEMHDLLRFLAGCSRFSGPDVEKHSHVSAAEKREKLIANILFRLRPNEAKWLVRLILKDLSPVHVDEAIVLRSFHFLLPDLLKFQDNLEAAVELLKGPLREYPDHPDPRSERLHRQSVVRSLRPAVGVKVGRPNFLKARSIDGCIDILGKRSWVLERKYDGEYCEIHIDLEASKKPAECIRIFSKSGKDSTRDRKALHTALIQALQLGHPSCKIKKRAILLGELVVYSDLEKAILPFDEIRKHVSRSGAFIGTKEDAAPRPGDHLAVVLFDLLLLDEETVMSRPVEERRSRLRQIYTKTPGKVMSAEWKVVDFADRASARKRLLEQFAASIAQRCEGLILKPCGVPYFCFEPTLEGRSPIKLKKDYIANMGDEADFAVIGASYDAQQALKSNISGFKWNSFHLGCLLNKELLIRFDCRPCFRFVGTISHQACIPRPVLTAANALGVFMAKPFNGSNSSMPFDLVSHGCPKMDVAFDEPFVFEVLGSGYEKPSNCDFFMLRHARAKKLHRDRTWKDCVSFQELQELGLLARNAPIQSESQETRYWIEKLESKCRKKMERGSTATPKARTLSLSGTDGRATSIPERMISSRIEASRRLRPSISPSLPLAVSSLDGTASVDGLHPAPIKRVARDGAYETPCRVTKKRCIVALTTDILSDEDVVVDKSQSSIKHDVLSNITNTAPQSTSHPSRPRPEKEKTNPMSSFQTPPVMFLPTPPLTKSQGPHSAVPQTFNPAIPALPVHQRADRSYRCLTSPCCPFAETVIFLSPCIATTPYIIDDLLPTHNLIITPDLAHWSRDSFSYLPLGETESESQSYQGLRKVILVESHRQKAVVDVIAEVLKLNGGFFRERIDVWDWRLLEVCVGHNVKFEDSRVRRGVVGATMVDEGAGKTIFVWDRHASQL